MHSYAQYIIMVFFSCDGCAEMLKKNQVDGHAMRCRRCASVSCVDCSVSFFGDDYRAHTSCISEVERYEKRTPKKNGKVPPQQLWTDLIASSITSAPAHLQSHIRTMSTLDNVPRKEKPFYNFTTNSLNLKGKHGNGIVAEIWKYLCDCRQMKQEMVHNRQQSKEEIGESSEAERVLSDDKQFPESLANNTEFIRKHSCKDDAELSCIKEVKSNDKEKIKAIDKKIVRKKMKQAFKTANSHSLTMKTLRNLVKEQFHEDEHMMVKKLIKKTVEQGKYFSQDGKTVALLKND